MNRTIALLLAALALVFGVATAAHAGSRWMSDPTVVSEAGRKLGLGSDVALTGAGVFTKSVVVGSTKGSAWK